MQLYRGDCLEVIPTLSIKAKAIFTDPPYGVTNNPWDLVYDFNAFFQNAWSILVDDGIIMKFGQDKFSAKCMLSDSNHKFNVVWQKDRPSGFLDAKKKPMRDHEDMMVFYKKQPTYYPQMEIGEKVNNSRGDLSKAWKTNNYSNYENMETEKTNLKYPRSVWKFPRPHPPIHPTQKPVALMERWILSYTKEGDTVIDTFMGIGTTGIACMRTGRNFIGIEKDEQYFAIAQALIENYDKFEGSPTVNTLKKLGICTTTKF